MAAGRADDLVVDGGFGSMGRYLVFCGSGEEKRDFLSLPRPREDSLPGGVEEEEVAGIREEDGLLVRRVERERDGGDFPLIESFPILRIYGGSEEVV